jgi:hypothetical protein
VPALPVKVPTKVSALPACVMMLMLPIPVEAKMPVPGPPLPLAK